MKKSMFTRYCSTIASLSLVLSYWFSTAMCRFIVHQPEEPKNLKEFLLEKKKTRCD